MGGEGRGLGEPTSGIGERHTKGPPLAIDPLGFAQKVAALAGGEMFAHALGGTQLRAGSRGGGPARFLEQSPWTTGRKKGGGLTWSERSPIAEAGHASG